MKADERPFQISKYFSMTSLGDFVSSLGIVADLDDSFKFLSCLKA